LRVADAAPAQDGHTRSSIIRLLLESGPVTASHIGEQLGSLAAGSVGTSTNRSRRRRRGARRGGLAAGGPRAAGQAIPDDRRGRAKLEHTYDDLASAAMRQLREIGGDAAIHTFARRRIDTILADVPRVDLHDDGDISGSCARRTVSPTR
jgi:hypothetical protein